MYSKKDGQVNDLGLISPPGPVAGGGFISGLRLWAAPEIPFNSASPNFLFGDAPIGQPAGTYINGRYGDEYHSSNQDIDTSNFNTNEAAFENEFTEWSNSTSYPALRGEGHPKGQAFKVVSGEVSGATQEQVFRVAASQIQWLWLFFYPPENTQDMPEFSARLTLSIETNGSTVSNAVEFTNPTFGRLSIRARQSNPQSSLTLRIKRFESETQTSNGTLPFRLAGRLGTLFNDQI